MKRIVCGECIGMDVASTEALGSRHLSCWDRVFNGRQSSQRFVISPKNRSAHLMQLRSQREYFFSALVGYTFAHPMEPALSYIPRYGHAFNQIPVRNRLGLGHRLPQFALISFIKHRCVSNRLIKKRTHSSFCHSLLVMRFI